MSKDKVIASAYKHGLEEAPLQLSGELRSYIILIGPESAPLPRQCTFQASCKDKFLHINQIGDIYGADDLQGTETAL